MMRTATCVVLNTYIMDERKIKPARLRKSTQHIKMGQLAKEISDRTGFTVSDITTVWRVGIDVIMESVSKNVGVVLPKIGMFYSMVTAPKASMSMNGGVGSPTKMITPPRRVLKFRVGSFVKDHLLSSPPTQEELDNIYED